MKMSGQFKKIPLGLVIALLALSSQMCNIPFIDIPNEPVSEEVQDSPQAELTDFTSTSTPTLIAVDEGFSQPSPTVEANLSALTSTVVPTPTSKVPLAATPPLITRFAVIGDYGLAGDLERDVANMIKNWSPDFIITTGDNNHPDGAAETIDKNIGQYFHTYIYPYVGQYGDGADVNRFFPTLGNHDWTTSKALPYFDYFTLPGNERYYDFVWGPVHLFAIDSDSREPDGVGRSSVQAQWLQEKKISCFIITLENRLYTPTAVFIFW
ncbi:MAG: metallophosphoesterase [Chloroflexi bacterium]|nr:metallophosphoesterase [Chloroflexota bacterium]MBU1661175.1 metallophosphoesterase [Chloroflexota bacterium]